jgi:hypothetical protein
MMDKETAMKKIRKCLALARSSEPHEAAAAMRQAQKLMEQCGIDHPELLAAGVSEDWAKSAACNTPSRYEVTLASLVSSAFTCELIFSRKLNSNHTRFSGGYSFVGISPMPEVATYTFTVLRRALLKARAEYVQVALKRYRKNKIAAADLFCEGWVAQVGRQIGAVEATEEQALAIDAYMRVNHAKLGTLKPRSRAVAKHVDPYSHRAQGVIAGRGVTVNAGIGGAQPLTAIAG